MSQSRETSCCLSLLFKPSAVDVILVIFLRIIILIALSVRSKSAAAISTLHLLISIVLSHLSVALSGTLVVADSGLMNLLVILTEPHPVLVLVCGGWLDLVLIFCKPVQLVLLIESIFGVGGQILVLDHFIKNDLDLELGGSISIAEIHLK